MPKCYTQQERDDIKRRLKETAADCMVTYGIRKTTVDELVRRTKIPKGTFYLFYESKEMLLFEVLMEFHEQVEQELFTQISELNEDAGIEEWTDVLLSCFLTVGKNPMFRIMTTGEIELLYKKLPPEILAEHLKEDDSNVEKLFSFLPISDVTQEEVAVYSAAFRNLFMTLIYQLETNQPYYEAAIRVSIRGLLIQMMRK
ncbi:MAG: TetR/AcrR family transcriptional regulator [Roseburia sp.]